MASIINQIAPLNPTSRKRCFDPVVDQNTRMLILGSLPGEQSLARNEYYGNRQNRFWMLMSEVIGHDLIRLDYSSRLKTLLENNIGLWDVVAEAHRDGSLDSQIRDRNDNDLHGLISTLPHLTIIAFNGGVATRLGLKILGERASRYHIEPLPSSSPANTIPYKEKLAIWRNLSIL